MAQKEEGEYIPRPTRDHARPQMASDIKMVARELMHEFGTAGLTLRGIARAMGVTAPAIYHYYPSLDHLITALIVDAYEAVSVAIADAITALPPTEPVQQLLAGLNAYRVWALAHPVEFQLIYGNPIPGYSAPEEVTTPLARRPFAEIGRILVELHDQGQLKVSDAYATIPPSIAAHIEEWRDAGGYEVPEAILYLVIAGWARIHGIVSLELFGHLRPALGDTEAFYRHELLALLAELGLSLQVS